jgi:hypothetical protein
VKEFVLSRDEAYEFEWKNMKTRRPGDPPMPDKPKTPAEDPPKKQKKTKKKKKKVGASRVLRVLGLGLMCAIGTYVSLVHVRSVI